MYLYTIIVLINTLYNKLEMLLGILNNIMKFYSVYFNT